MKSSAKLDVKSLEEAGVRAPEDMRADTSGRAASAAGARDGTRSEMGVGEAYVCEHCGYVDRDSRPVDELQCPMCGEPVTPLR